MDNSLEQTGRRGGRLSEVVVGEEERDGDWFIKGAGPEEVGGQGWRKGLVGPQIESEFGDLEGGRGMKMVYSQKKKKKKSMPLENMLFSNFKKYGLGKKDVSLKLSKLTFWR